MVSNIAFCSRKKGGWWRMIQTAWLFSGGVKPNHQLVKGAPWRSKVWTRVETFGHDVSFSFISIGASEFDTFRDTWAQDCSHSYPRILARRWAPCAAGTSRAWQVTSMLRPRTWSQFQRTRPQGGLWGIVTTGIPKLELLRVKPVRTEHGGMEWLLMDAPWCHSIIF